MVDKRRGGEVTSTKKLVRVWTGGDRNTYCIPAGVGELGLVGTAETLPVTDNADSELVSELSDPPRETGEWRAGEVAREGAALVARATAPDPPL